MKAILLTFLSFLGLMAFAGPRPAVRSYNALPRSFFTPYLGPAASGRPTEPEIPKSDEQILAEEWKRRIEFAYTVDQPWRAVHGETNLVIGADWYLFQGRIVQVLPGGILIDGFYDLPFSQTFHGNNLGNLFFVAGFPYSTAEGDRLRENQKWMAKLDGTFSYQNVSGSATTVHKLTYGTPCAPPAAPSPTAGEIEARSIKLEAKKSESRDKVLKFHQDLAAKGDPYGEYQMGLRYLKGDGVEKNLAKARQMFSKAAAQGHQDAATELSKLPAP